MTQAKLQLRTSSKEQKSGAECASEVGLSWGEDGVVLRFLEGNAWGNRSRLVKLDRQLAEQLAQLLNYEIDLRDQEAQVFA